MQIGFRVCKVFLIPIDSGNITQNQYNRPMTCPNRHANDHTCSPPHSHHHSCPVNTDVYRFFSVSHTQHSDNTLHACNTPNDHTNGHDHSPSPNVAPSTRIAQGNMKMPLALSGSALVLPGDVGSNQVNYAPDFNGDHPQGVPLDSLESFRVIGSGGYAGTMYCSHVTYTIYLIVYNMCEEHGELVV